MTPTNTVARSGSRPRSARSGVTLIELLVVMALIAALGALALMLLPAIANSDNTLKGASAVQTACKQAQGMAGTARMPRGVRFLVLPGGYISKEMQFIESPPVMVADPQVLVAKAGDPNGANTPNGPRVEFLYELYSGSEPSLDPTVPGNPPVNSIKRRHCFIVGLTADQENQIADGGTLVLPTLGVWLRITGPGTTVPATNPPPPPRRLEVPLEVYPDANLGGATAFRSYHFGIYGPPVPLLAEPTVPLPINIGVDLSISFPPLQTAGKHFDILFAPSGQTVYFPSAISQAAAANTGVFLWVRDVDKTDMIPTTMPATVPPYLVTAGTTAGQWQFDMNKFRKGGEQQIVGIRNGFVGSAPVLWPQTSGAYNAGQNPYIFARDKLN